jgi:hypothetical protein
MTRPASPEPRFGPIVALAVVSFVVYAYFRARHVGGCDSFAYLVQSLIFRGQDPVPLALDPREHPAVVPLCMHYTGAKLVSVFPIGYPLLLTVAGAFGLEFLLNSMLGAASVLLLYPALAPVGGRGIALGLTVMWATTPIVAWGATMLMSDLPAAVFVLASYVLLSRQRPKTSGALLGFALGIRPTNVVVLPVFAYIAHWSSTLRPFAGAVVVVGACFAVYGVGAYGSLFAAPYSGHLNAMGFGSVLDNAWVLLSNTFVMLWPVVLLGIVAVIRRPRQSVPLLCWFGVYLALYGFWDSDISAWWYTRYLLPGYPALFLLAAHGARELSDISIRRFATARRALPLAAAPRATLATTVSTRRPSTGIMWRIRGRSRASSRPAPSLRRATSAARCASTAASSPSIGSTRRPSNSSTGRWRRVATCTW